MASDSSSLEIVPDPSVSILRNAFASSAPEADHPPNCAHAQTTLRDEDAHNHTTLRLLQFSNLSPEACVRGHACVEVVCAVIRTHNTSHPYPSQHWNGICPSAAIRPPALGVQASPK